jgi:maleamate amidohydrolase
MLEATVAWDDVSHVWDDIVTEPMAMIYRAYARPLGLGARPAVLAIDLYNLAFAGGARPPHELQEEFRATCGEYAYAAIEPITQVLSAARQHGVPVLHAVMGSPRSGISPTTRTSTATAADRDFYPGLGPVDGEVVIEKERASAFYGTQLVAELVSRGIDTVIVVGESTSGCVRASVVDGHSNGFHMVTVEDAVFDRAWLTHQVNLFDLHHKYADGLDAATVTRLLTAVAAGS